jgi:hypothetical protein
MSLSPAPKEARLCYVWTGKPNIRRIEDAPQNGAASSTRGTLVDIFQMFHVWLPSTRRFTAKNAC